VKIHRRRDAHRRIRPILSLPGKQKKPEQKGKCLRVLKGGEMKHRARKATVGMGAEKWRESGDDSGDSTCGGGYRGEGEKRNPNLTYLTLAFAL